MRAANDQNLFRRTIGAEIERLIALLDTIEGDCDLEDGGDPEPSLGWSEMECRYGKYPEGAQDERELEDEHDEDGADSEPEETDEDGDEQDSSRSEDDNAYGGAFVMGRLDGGSGI